MRKFIVKLLYFVVVFILLSYFTDLILSNVISNTSLYVGECEVWSDIFDGKIDADIAIYGSSRAWVHFNPKIFEEILGKTTYNFGIDGNNFRLQYLRHKEYFKYNKHPNMIILSLDIFSLSKNPNLYNAKQFLPYMLWNKDIYEFTKFYNAFDVFDYIIPFKRYIGIFGNFHIDFIPYKKLRYHGFRGVDQKWNDDLEKAREQFSNYTVKIDTSLILLLKRFIDEMKIEKINIIFVYAPEYIEGQSFVHNRGEIFNIFRKISKNNRIPFFDYSNSYISYNKGLFYNSLHLNKKGADIFTRQFIKDLETYNKKQMILSDTVEK